jgi:C4-dicarboxylate transporter DctQ subunit
MTGIVIIEVFLRYLFGKTLYVTEELSRYLMVSIVFLGASLALKGDSHINIGFFTSKLPLRYRKYVALIAQLLLFGFLVALLLAGLLVLPYQLEQNAVSMNIRMFWFYLSIPVGSLLMILYLIPKMSRIMRQFFSKDSDLESSSDDSS